MNGNLIRFPFLRRVLHGAPVYELEMTLEVRTHQQIFIPLRFLFDSGTHFTTIPLATAQRLQIPYSLAQPVPLRSATGTGQGYLALIGFSFPQWPQWQFETRCCFVPAPLTRALLCLTDLITHCALRTLPPNRLHPNGSLVMQLLPNHRGQPRP